MKQFGMLRERIKIVYGKNSNFAKAMGFDDSTLSSKLSSKTEWTRKEIEKSCSLLELPIDEIPNYFFYQ